MRAHSSPTRAYLLEAMVYDVCTLSSRARKSGSQLITCRVENRCASWKSVDTIVCYKYGGSRKGPRYERARTDQLKLQHP
jgi:hypothetical protein